MTPERNAVSFLEMLLLLFIGLKLSDIIHWSWWWVMSPVWIPLVAIVILVIAGSIARAMLDRMGK